MTNAEPDLTDLFTDEAVATEADLNDSFTDEKQPELIDLGGFGADEKKPAPHGKREPVADLVTFAWGGIGMALVQTRTDIPVGRVMQFQAPLAGQKFDALIAGTWLDAFLQPFAKQADKIEGLGALVMFPLLVGAYERNPALEPIIAPILRQVVRQNITEMAPVLKKQQRDAQKAAEAISDLNDIMDIPSDQDPIDAILGMIFSPMTTEETTGE